MWIKGDLLLSHSAAVCLDLYLLTFGQCGVIIALQYFQGIISTIEHEIQSVDSQENE